MPPPCKKSLPAVLGQVIATLLLLISADGMADQAASAPSFSPYIEHFASGRIDWDRGRIYGVGRAYLDANDNSPIKARRAADLLASANIVRLATGIRLDDHQTLAALGAAHATLRIEAQLRDEGVENIRVDDGTRPYFQATRVAELKGIAGLTAKLLTALAELDITWQAQPSAPEDLAIDSDKPWLVLDARSLPAQARLQPALLPKIVSATGDTLYEVARVERSALASRGMARYVISPDHLGRSTGHDLPASLRAAIDRLLGVPTAEAADGKRRKRRRYIVTEVKQAHGLTQTTLMISAKDAEKVKKENHSSQILKKCRVIVVMSSPIGGIEGRLPGRLALLGLQD